MSSDERPAKRMRNGGCVTVSGAQCPYMDTVDRAALDFDFEHVCSVSLEALNVYACLVCGKFFQGRSPSTHAYAHALDESHHLFLNLRTETVHCLPDGYRVQDSAFDDILFALRPRFSKDEVARLDSVSKKFRVLDGSYRLQGIVGLDNLRATDYAAIIFQLLICVSPIRDYLLLDLEPLSADPSKLPHGPAASSPHRDLRSALGALARKIWTPMAFRAHVSPHEIMQLVSRLSAKRYSLLKQADPLEFFSWLVGVLTTKKSAPFSRLLKDTFQGKMEITSFAQNGESSTRSSAFWFLALDLPPKPLFKDASERTLVPQVPLSSLLTKYDGTTRHHIVKTGEHKTYKLQAIPPFLLLAVKRFLRTKFGTLEKNPCVVHLPSAGLDMSDLVGDGSGANYSTRYSLIAAVVHDGEPGSGAYHIAVRHKATNSWFDIRDMTTKSTLPQLVALAQTYMLLYARD